MGSDPTPVFSDLFFPYEWKKSNNLKKENVIYVTPKSLSYNQIYS